jgi:hypothetical protein
MNTHNASLCHNALPPSWNSIIIISLNTHNASWIIIMHLSRVLIINLHYENMYYSHYSVTSERRISTNLWSAFVQNPVPDHLHILYQFQILYILGITMPLIDLFQWLTSNRSCTGSRKSTTAQRTIDLVYPGSISISSFGISSTEHLTCNVWVILQISSLTLFFKSNSLMTL